MKEPDEIQKLVDEISFRKSNNRDYQKMNAKQISKELCDVMSFEQKSFKLIEEFEKTQQDQDLIKYLKMICRNTTEREITQIQEIYLEKIDKEYLNSK